MTAFLIVIVVVVVFGLLIAGASNKAALNKTERDTFLAQHEGWDVYVSPQDKSLLGIHHDQREVMVGKVGASRVFSWSQISSVEVIRDGHAITSTNRASQFGGAAIGGLAFGPVGMIIGGLSGKSKTQEKISDIRMKILIDDRVAPVHHVTFLHFPSGVQSGSKMIEMFTKRLDHFHALVVNAIRAESTLTVKPAPPLIDGDNFDKVERLWKLKEMGAITDEEFATQKSALLAPSILVSPAPNQIRNVN